MDVLVCLILDVKRTVFTFKSSWCKGWKGNGVHVQEMMVQGIARVSFVALIAQIYGNKHSRKVNPLFPTLDIKIAQRVSHVRNAYLTCIKVMGCRIPCAHLKRAK